MGQRKESCKLKQIVTIQIFVTIIVLVQIAITVQQYVKNFRNNFFYIFEIATLNREDSDSDEEWVEGNEDEESYIKTKEGMKGVFQCSFI